MDSLVHNLEGVNLDGLRFIAKLGAGGMGEVWLGHDEDLDISIAIKVLRPEFATDQSFLVRFLREARACAKLEHPNIVRVMQAGRRSWAEGNLRLMVMEYVEGPDASVRLKSQPEGKVSPKRAAEIVLATAKALKYAHARGVIHRDIKPANIVLANDGGIKVLDFGLAKLMAPNSDLSQGASLGTPSKERLPEDRATLTNAILGTPHYMSPEQAQGRVADGRSDVYSLGITLYQLVTGVLPFDGDSPFTIISGHVLEELPLKEEHFDGMSPLLVDLLSGMCAKKPEERTRLKQVIDLLTEFVGGASPDSARRNEGATQSARATPRTNLTPRTTSFVGREDELSKIAEIIKGDGTRLTTILGPGGVGKTRIAQEFGLRALEAFEGGVYFCDLTEARSVQGVASDVGKGLGVSLTQSDPVQQIHESLRAMSGKILIILDNFEQVIDHAAETLGVWLQETPNVKFLASSREPLHLEGEKSFPLAPLSQKAKAPLTAKKQLGDQSMDPPVQLFVDRASDVKRGFALCDENREAIEEICKALDGIPLAIELAAARCSALSPRKILERLPRRFDLLKSRRKDQSERQQTLRSTIDWSWNLLTPPEKSALAQCSVFLGGFFLEAAEAVIEVGEFEDAPFEIDIVEALVEKSLLTAYEVLSLPGETRYRMLESVRQYAEEKLSSDWQDGPRDQESADKDSGSPNLLVRHAKFYLEYVEGWSQARRGASAVEAHDRIELEMDDLFAIQERFSSEAPAFAARAVLAASNTLRTRGPTQPLLAILESSHVLLGESESVLRAKLLLEICRVNTDFGNFEVAVEYGDRTVVLSQEIGGEVGRKILGAALGSRAIAFKDLGEFENALEDFSRAEIIDREFNNLYGLASNINNRAIIFKDRRQFAEAIESFSRAEEIYREIGSAHGEAMSIGNRGLVYADKGDFEMTLDSCREAVKLGRRLGNKRMLNYMLFGLAQGLFHVSNDLPGALAAAEEGEAIRRELGMENTEEFHEILGLLAAIHWKMEHRKIAREYAELSKSTAEKVGISRLETFGPHKGSPRQITRYIEEVLGPPSDEA